MTCIGALEESPLAVGTILPILQDVLATRRTEAFSTHNPGLRMPRFPSIWELGATLRDPPRLSDKFLRHCHPRLITL